MRNTNPLTQEAQNTPIRINTKVHTHIHTLPQRDIIFNPQRVKDKAELQKKLE
jgi:hypothetical protein